LRGPALLGAVLLGLTPASANRLMPIAGGCTSLKLLRHVSTDELSERSCSY
jgi:hypothetical protein